MDQGQCWSYLPYPDCSLWMSEMDKGLTRIQSQWALQHLHKSIYSKEIEKKIKSLDCLLSLMKNTWLLLEPVNHTMKPQMYHRFLSRIETVHCAKYILLHKTHDCNRDHITASCKHPMVVETFIGHPNLKNIIMFVFVVGQALQTNHWEFQTRR